MKEYLKSLFPYRWTLIFIFILCMEYIISVGKMGADIHFINLTMWFALDLIGGIGREVKKPNMFALIYLGLVLIYLFLKV